MSSIGRPRRTRRRSASVVQRTLFRREAKLLKAIEERLCARARFVFTLAEEDRAALTPRERDCLALAAQGFREAEIAERNGIRPTTVRYHMDNVVAKLGARTRAHAVAIAAQLGLVATR